MIQLRTVSLIFVALLLFGSGWAIGELRHFNNETATRDLIKSSMELSVNSTAMADKSLNQTLTCQETLNICLQHLGFRAVPPRTMP